MLHPQARALLDLMIERGVPPTQTLTPEEARRFYRERRFYTQPAPEPVAEVRELAAEGPAGPIPMRLYRPAGTAVPRPACVYYHGGGWVIGDLDTHDSLCRQLANASGCTVIAVDYRLAPEHRFPAAVDDAFAALQWVQREAASLSVDRARIAVGGDSAGGNLAAAVSLLARDAGTPPAYQLLIYPATDQRRIAPSHERNGRGYLLERETMAYYTGHYMPDPAMYLDWRGSPLLHPDLSNLAPALVLTAGYDPLRDEGVDYAQRLTLAGNHCALVSFERQIHGFITMGKVIDEANDAVRLCANALRDGLAG